MTTVNGVWSEKENAWVSEVLKPKGDIWLIVSLPKNGYVIVRQTDHETGKAPKCYQSHEGKTFKVRITCCDENDLQVFTSVTPDKIEYANI